MGAVTRALKHVSLLKSLFIPIIAALAPIPLLVILDTKESKCGYVIILMAILWLTEAIPISATALIPIFIFPMLGVANAKTVSGSYFTDTSMLFLGGLFIAVAVEEWGLHKRVAVGVMRLIGTQPAMLMLGLMLPTWFLSMWISNTAATAMMLPIIQAVIQTFKEVNDGTYGDTGVENLGFEVESSVDEQPGDPNSNVSVSTLTMSDSVTKSSEDIIRPQRKDPQFSPDEFLRMAKGFSLCVAYAANMGGIATLTGTPPNLVLKEQADALYKEWSDDTILESPINFADWMGFAFPLSLLGLVLCWLWLCVYFLRKGAVRRLDAHTKTAVNATILNQWRAMGRITLAEIEIIVLFALLVVFWLFRAPPNIDGWGKLFDGPTKDEKYVSDSTPVMLLCILMFILPAKKPQVFCFAEDKDKPSFTPILTWKAAEKKVPWGVLILLGGGFAIAKMSQESGLSQWMGNELRVFSSQDPWVMNLVICAISAIATEVTSNTATTTLLLPILSSLALSIGVHPLYLMVSTAVACSFAFMLPVATPPNAIVFSTGWLTIPDMAIAGLPMNILALCCLTFAINTWGKAIYKLDEFPDVFQTTTASPLNITTPLR